MLLWESLQFVETWNLLNVIEKIENMLNAATYETGRNESDIFWQGC